MSMLVPIPVECGAAVRLFEKYRHTVFCFLSLQNVFVIIPIGIVVPAEFGWSEEDAQLIGKAHEGGFWALMHVEQRKLFYNPRVSLKNGKLVLLSEPKITTKLE